MIDKTGDTVAAVLAAYNLEMTIKDVVARTQQYVDYVIVAADGSTDNTAEIASQNGAIVPNSTLQRGKGFAVIKGINASRIYDPDIIVLMDADGQHLPEEIPKLLEPIRAERLDMVIGSRMLGELRTSTINKFGNFILKAISFLVTGKWVTDTETGFRAFKADKLYELNLTSRGYELESEILIKAIKCNYATKEVPITVPVAIPGITVVDGVKMGLYKVKLALKLAFTD